MLSSLWRLNIATLLFFTFVQLVVPLIPQYAVGISTSPFLIGFAVSCVSITAIIFRPVCGVLSDRGSRFRFMLLGLLLASAAYVALFFSKDIFMVAEARLVEGVGVASFVPSSIASAVDQAPPGKLGQTLGWRSLMIGTGFTVGPALGGAISQLVGYTDTFGLTAILLLCIIPLVVHREPTRCRQVGHSMDGIRERGFLLALMGNIVYCIAWMGLQTFLYAYLKLLNYGNLEITLFVSIEAVTSLALRVLSGRVADTRPAMLTYTGLLIISLSFFSVYLAPLPPLLYIASVIFGVGVGIFVPGSQTLALSKSPRGSSGFLASLYTMGTDIGTLVGPLAFGVVIEITGSYPSVFELAPLIVLIAALVVFIPTKFFSSTSRV
jgi:MFS family permease